MDEELLKISEAAKRLGVTPQTLRNWEKSGQLQALRFHAKGNRMYRESDLLKLLHQFSEGIGPVLKWVADQNPLTPPETFYCQFRDQFSARLWKEDLNWKKLFGVEKSSLISAMVGEIGNNSFDHNLGKWPDLPGIWLEWFEVGKGLIVIADRGVGILKSLQQVRPTLSTHEEALKVAFNEVVTGRAPESRGNGLKFVKSLVNNHQFKLSFQSGNAHLKLENGKETIETTFNSIQGCLAIINL